YAEYKNTRLSVDRLAAVDSLRTLQPTTNTSTLNSLSFLSASVPVGSRLAVGFSIYQFLDYHETFTLAPRLIPGDPGQNVFSPIDASADFNARSYGGSVAFAITPQLRVGATIGASHLDASSQATRSGVIFGTAFPSNPNAITKSPIIDNQTSISDNKTAASGTLGVLYKINDMVSAGFTFAKGPKFTSSENAQTNPGFNNNVLAGAANLPLVQANGFPRAFAFNVPDQFGFGVSLRPKPVLLITADVVRINYSSLSENTTIIFNSDPPQLTGTEYRTAD